MQRDEPPIIQLPAQKDATVRLAGAWLIHALSNKQTLAAVNASLAGSAQYMDAEWDLTEISAIDHLGANLLWQAWSKRLPNRIKMNPAHQGLFARLEEVSKLPIPQRIKPRLTRVMRVGSVVLTAFSHLMGLMALLGQLMLDLGKFARHPIKGPWKELSANVYRTGFQALGITALVGLLIGIVLSYLTAQQLRAFGGDLFLVNILGMSIVRELGPMLAAILVAGRSGSAITAQLGVMRVTEELDAMSVMGIPIGYRLIMPKVLALALTMPLIVIWTDVMALIGGMIAAKIEIDMSPQFFLHKLPDAVAIANFWIGLGKGFVFGMLIAIVACHYGLRIQPNTESLGQGTTSSVVISITTVIIADALFAVFFSRIGY
jgi:phospholipid/cholesterol/gamma-HCH transport system permease protein